MSQLQIDVGLNNQASDDYGNNKLYGLYRSSDEGVIFRDDDYSTKTYNASSFAGIQKLLNMNEAAFDPANNLLPSLG